MKRQNIRNILMDLSAYLFPITFLFLSPVIPFAGIFNREAKGIFVGSLVVFLLQFSFSIFFGRLFCGWLCPGGAFQERFCSNVNDKVVKVKKIDKIKYFIWIPWFIGLISGFIAVGGIKRVDFLFNTYFKEPIGVWGQFIIIYFAISALIMIITNLTGRRGFCHSTCWMSPFMILGKEISKKLKFPYLKLKAEKDKCIKCKICNRNCVMSLDVMEMVSRGNIHHNECILCGNCADSCPKSIIKYSFKN